MRRRHLSLSFVAGACVMSAEMAASRLVAPYFGSTTVVWGTLIAFVLGGLAVGAWSGGRIADRLPRLDVLCGALAGAAAIIAILPLVARATFGSAVSAVLGGRPAAAIAPVIGFAALALIPVVALGAAGPFILRVADARDDLGARAGALSAANTLGSIFGTLATVVLFIPAFGTARTMAGCALLLAVAATWSASVPRRVLAAAVPAAALALAPAALPRHARAIDVVESEYALVQTLQQPDGRRDLVLDQPYAIQSTTTARGGAGEVFAHFALAPDLVAAPSAAPRVLLLGLGAGTAARAILERYPEARVVGVEIDPAVVAMARRHFALPESVEVHVADARRWLAVNELTFDVILVDAFRFPYIPFQLTTIEFDRLLASRLAPGGVACLNVGRHGNEKAVVEAVASTLANVFPEVVAVDAWNRSNTLLFASHAPGIAGRLRDRWPRLDEPWRDLGARVLTGLRPVTPGVPLTDDRAPVEQLTDGILLRALAGKEPL